MRWVGIALWSCCVSCGPSPGASSGGGGGEGESGDTATDSGDDGSSGADVESSPGLQVGDRSTCVLLPELVCWGYNGAGQLGVGNDEPVVEPTALPFSPTAVALSFMAGCLVADGAVQCAGVNGNGLLVQGGASELFTHVPVAIDGAEVVTVTAGFAHHCALRADGTMVCWGDNFHGALGPDIPSTGTPTLVAGLADIVSISAGTDHTCAAVSDGSAWCWGSNDYGQLGNPDHEYPFTPVAGLTDVVEIHASGSSTCALHGDGHISCWGRASENQLGVPPESLDTCVVVVPGACTRTPVTLPGITTARAMDLGNGGCALTDDGVSCWGDFAKASTSGGFAPAPIEVPGAALEVDVGSEHACIRTTEGVFCWGRGTEGQLGPGTLENTDTPVQAF